MIWKIVLFLICFEVTGMFLQRRKCCKDENLITMNETCVDNSTLASLTCKDTYILDPKDISTYNFTIDEQDFLVIDLEGVVDYYVPPDKYCLGRLNETDDETEAAAILCQMEEETKEDYFYLKMASAIVSLFLYTVIILIYLVVPTLRDLFGRCLIITVLSLAVAYICMVILQLYHDFPNDYCVYIVSGIYVCVLIGYFWLSILAFHILQKVLIFQRKPTFWFIIYCLYGFGVPMLLLLSVLLTSNIGMSSEILKHMHMSCWRGSKSTRMFIYGPMLILLLLTSSLTLYSVKKLWNDVEPDNVSRRTIALRCKCLIVFYVFLILALTAIVETLAYFIETQSYEEYIWFYTDLIQATLLLIVLVICRKRTIKGLGMFGFCCISCPQKCQSVIDDEDRNQPFTQENKSYF